MSLSKHRVGATIAVTDIGRATSFYEEKLGLSAAEQMDGARVYGCGGGSSLLVYESEHAGATNATVATWEVDDLERVVDELTAAGVAFEQYDEPLRTDQKGIHDSEEGKIAWLRDPDGNTIAIGEFS